MSKHKWTVVLVVDDEALAEHDDEHQPPPKDIEDWEFRDISAAIDRGIVDPDESEVDWYEGEVTKEGN